MSMNKSRRVAVHKHRIRRQKLKEKRRREKALPGRPTGSSARGGPAQTRGRPAASGGVGRGEGAP